MSLLTSKMIRTGLTVVMAAGVLTTMSGCTDNEVVASALVIGAAAVISSDDNPPPPRHWHHEDHFRPGPPPFRPGPGPGFGHDGFDHHRHELAGAVDSSALDAAAAKASAAQAATSASAAAFKSSDKRVQNLAKGYGITEYAATYAVRAIVLAQTKDTTGIEALGLSVGDMKELYQGKQALAADKIESAAATMKMTTAATAQFFSDLQADTAAEKAARGL